MAADHAAEVHSLKSLWRDQIDYVSARPWYTAWLAYMQSQMALDITLERRLRVTDMISPHLTGRVLEWGCHAGFDSCVYKMRFGDRLELYGCDFLDPDLYKPFYDFSGLHYSRLAHGYRLDYPDAFFEVVTSDGVLEHVPDEVHSVQEIRRILRPGGAFVVACLPNRYSYTELFHRLRRGPAHERLYTVSGARELLERHGFQVTLTRRFFMLPTMLNGVPPTIKDAYQRRQGLLWSINDVLERVWPLNQLASNLMIVARSRE